MSRKLEIELELRIVRKCAEDAIAQGYSVSVNDGEETPLKKSRDIEAIMKAVFSTDEDYLVFYKLRNAEQIEMLKENGEAASEYKKVGWARFIYGNVEAVLSDYSANAEVEAIVKGATALAAEYD